MKLFSSQSTLRSRLIIVIMLCCSIALLLNTGFIFGINSIDFKKNKVIRLFILADVLAKNSTAALKFSDKKTAQEILQSAVADNSINHVALLDEACQLFEEYSNSVDKNIKPSEVTFVCDGKRNYFYSSNYLYLSVPVMLEQEQVGTLSIKSDLKDLIKLVNRQVQVLSVLFILTLMIAFLLTFKLQMIFLTPIKDLLAAIRHITEHKDYSVQVESHTHDELAILADEFNDMIAKINQHDKLLSNQNQLLEQKVDRRTYQLQENLKQLEKAKETAEVASQAKSDFLSHMSHDLRTPLNSLLGYIQVLQRKKDFPAKYQNEIKIIGHCSQYLLSLINDLLDLTKIESGKLELRNQVFNPRDFLTPIIEIFSEQAQEKGLEFIFNVEGNLPSAIIGDENRLRRILSNLLENAFKFTEQGSVTFTVSYKNDVIDFSIIDTGCGINEKYLKAIFEPFNQFSRKLDNDGIGLGLYITHYLVELMQGKLKINSKLKQGTACYLTLPLPVEQSISSSKFSQYDDVIAYQGDIKTILVVDDKPMNRELLRAMLEPIGFKVICVNSGQACLDKLQKTVIDIILLDMVMPVLTGVDTCQHIRQLQLSRQPKIIMVTANAFADDREKSLRVGCDSFLAKPVILNQLLEIIEQQLSLQWIYQVAKDVNKQNNPPLTPLKIMVAEDDEICRLLMLQNLKDAGFEAEIVVDGAQAIQLAQRSKFDCIILDYKMPNKTGIEVADHIRNQQLLNKDSYLVLMTAMTNDKIIAEAMNIGFNEVIAKPIELDMLVKLMRVVSQCCLAN
ncbi:MAG: response regulator [Methylococcales bacterium]